MGYGTLVRQSNKEKEKSEFSPVIEVERDGLTQNSCTQYKLHK